LRGRRKKKHRWKKKKGKENDPLRKGGKEEREIAGSSTDKVASSPSGGRPGEGKKGRGRRSTDEGKERLGKFPSLNNTNLLFLPIEIQTVGTERRKERKEEKSTFERKKETPLCGKNCPGKIEIKMPAQWD